MTWVEAIKRPRGFVRVAGPPSVRWTRQDHALRKRTNGNPRDRRATARFSVAASELLFTLAGELGIDEPVGIRVFLGTGDDEGKVGFQPDHFHGPKDRHVYALSVRAGKNTKQAVFSSSELCAWQERGWTLVERVDSMLVGTMGTNDPPGLRKPKR